MNIYVDFTNPNCDTGHRLHGRCVLMLYPVLELLHGYVLECYEQLWCYKIIFSLLYQQNTFTSSCTKSLFIWKCTLALSFWSFIPKIEPKGLPNIENISSKEIFINIKAPERNNRSVILRSNSGIRNQHNFFVLAAATQTPTQKLKKMDFRFSVPRKLVRVWYYFKWF